MERFHAMFSGNHVYVNRKYPYLNNEILVRYLNLDTSHLEDFYQELKALLPLLLLTPKLSEIVEQKNYEERVQAAQRILSAVDKIALATPPYDVCMEMANFLKENPERLFRCLMRHTMIFGENAAAFIEDTLLKNMSFNPAPFIEKWQKEILDKRILLKELYLFNLDVKNTILPYLNWLEDVLRVQWVYRRLLEEYLHIRHGFLKPHETAAQFSAYLQSEQQDDIPYHQLGHADPLTVSHEVFSPEDSEQPLLCLSFDFDRIGAFLYMDFFNGLEKNHLPKRCANCGRWFLLPAGKYSDYCEQPLEGNPEKTCRSSSARKKYDEKCKNDPVWAVYNRAYKAHYARYMKKKMTLEAFEEWVRHSVSLREHVIHGEMDMEEYMRVLKL